MPKREGLAAGDVLDHLLDLLVALVLSSKVHQSCLDCIFLKKVLIANHLKSFDRLAFSPGSHSIPRLSDRFVRVPSLSNE